MFSSKNRLTGEKLCTNLCPLWQGLVVDGLYQEGVVQVVHLGERRRKSGGYRSGGEMRIFFVPKYIPTMSMPHVVQLNSVIYINILWICFGFCDGKEFCDHMEGRDGGVATIELECGAG